MFGTHYAHAPERTTRHVLFLAGLGYYPSITMESPAHVITYGNQRHAVNPCSLFWAVRRPAG